MRQFTHATAWHAMAFLRADDGNIWRVWFDDGGHMTMERLTSQQIEEYGEAVDQLAVPT